MYCIEGMALNYNTFNLILKFSINSLIFLFLAILLLSFSQIYRIFIAIHINISPKLVILSLFFGRKRNRLKSFVESSHNCHNWQNCYNFHNYHNLLLITAFEPNNSHDGTGIVLMVCNPTVDEFSLPKALKQHIFSHIILIYTDYEYALSPTPCGFLFHSLM